MKKLTKSIIVMCLFSALLLGAAAVYAAGEGVKMGTLTVKAVPGSGKNLIIRSSVDVEAVFTDTAGKKEYYIGEMGYKLGVDLSIKSHEQLEYAVFSPSTAYETGSYALQGKYFGQKATAQMGIGGGAQILLGGLDKSISLQPLALTGTKGYGVSAGLGYLYLQADLSK
jgi:hypothetical protein